MVHMKQDENRYNNRLNFPHYTVKGYTEDAFICTYVPKYNFIQTLRRYEIKYQI